MRIKFFCLLGLLLCGCVKNGQTEFFQVLRDHQKLTGETIPPVVDSIRHDLNEHTGLSKEQRDAIEALIMRLTYIQRQSDVLYKYYVAKEVDEKLISELIKNVWEKKP